MEKGSRARQVRPRREQEREALVKRRYFRNRTVDKIKRCLSYPWEKYRRAEQSREGRTAGRTDERKGGIVQRKTGITERRVDQRKEGYKVGRTGGFSSGWSSCRHVF